MSPYLRVKSPINSPPQMSIHNAVYENLAGFDAQRFNPNLKEEDFLKNIIIYPN